MNEKTESLSCKDCKYFADYTGDVCMRAHGFKQVLVLLLLGPKPLFNTDGCESFAKKNINNRAAQKTR